MKKFIALGLMACAGMVNAAAGEGFALSKEKGIHQTKFVDTGLYANFNECAAYSNYGKEGDKLLACEKGKQFTILHDGGEFKTIATYALYGKKAFVSQTRIGYHPFLGAGMVFEVAYKDE